MFSGLIKLTVGAALVAAFAGTMLSSTVTPPAQSAHTIGAATAANAAPAPSVKAKSWFGGWFEGMQFSRDSAPAAKPAAPVQTAAVSTGSGYGRMELRPGPGGHYETDIEVEGQRVSVLVDTGATLLSLTYEDAGKLGIRPAPADYTANIATANGMAKAARVNVREVRLGTLEVRNVDALVMPRDVKGKTLLGMSFLKKLSGFEVTGGNLVLRQ